MLLTCLVIVVIMVMLTELCKVIRLEIMVGLSNLTELIASATAPLYYESSSLCLNI